MDEYVCKDVLRQVLEERFFKYIADEIMEDLPTADVQEVKHGKWKEEENVRGFWIKASDVDGDYWCCGVCEAELPRVCVEPATVENIYGRYKSIEPTPYCPNCGAKMDKEDEK